MKQNYEIKSDAIREQFLAYKKANPELLKNRLKFSWSNWGFGLESFETSCERLNRAGISYIELHGNHYGADLGYNNDASCFVTPEPLGPGGDPYPAQNAKTDPAILDKLVFDSVNYFRSREETILAL